MPLDPTEIQRYLDDAVAAENTDVKGKTYEALAVYLFEAVPGCFTEHNLTSFFGMEQVDVGVGNARTPDGFPLLPPAILVECKDWTKPVDSATVGYFINILANRSIEVGVLFAANGITGNPHEMTYAHGLGVSAMARGIKVLVVTSDEIRSLTCTQDLIDMLNSRYLRAIMKGGLGVPE